MADVSSSQNSTKRNVAILVIIEAVALAIGAWAMIQFELGWPGVIGMGALVVLFTLTLFRAGERRAIETGNFSAAMGRYNRRMLVASALYVAGLFAAIWAHDELSLNSLSAFAFAFLPSVGVLAMIWAMARLLAEEEDEYQRHRHVRASLFGLGTLLTLSTIWGFFEQFDLVPHVPTWAAVPVFALGLGFAHCFRWGRA